MSLSIFPCTHCDIVLWSACHFALEDLFMLDSPADGPAWTDRQI
jgi:hypothetical protein